MHRSNVKRKLKQNEPVLAAKVNFMAPQIAELVGLVGFDCLWICNEHISADIGLINQMVVAARSAGMDTLIRRNVSGYHDLLQPLELGVHGLMIPRVRDVDYIKRVVEYAKFPPLGKRGLDGVNADSDFGLISMGGYLKRANEETFIVAQIEDPEAVSIIDAVAAVEGVDVLFVGIGDLSLGFGIPGQFRHESILEIIDRTAEACAKHGKIPGTPAMDPEDTARLIEKGYRFFTMGADYRFIKNGLLKAREEFSSLGFSFRELPREGI